MKFDVQCSQFILNIKYNDIINDQIDTSNKSNIKSEWYTEILIRFDSILSMSFGCFFLFCSSINFNYSIEIGNNISINISHSVVNSCLFEVFVWLAEIDSVTEFDDLAYLNRNSEHCIVLHINVPNAKLNDG